MLREPARICHDQLALHSPTHPKKSSKLATWESKKQNSSKPQAIFCPCVLLKRYHGALLHRCHGVSEKFCTSGGAEGSWWGRCIFPAWHRKALVRASFHVSPQLRLSCQKPYISEKPSFYQGLGFDAFAPRLGVIHSLDLITGGSGFGKPSKRRHKDHFLYSKDPLCAFGQVSLSDSCSVQLAPALLSSLPGQLSSDIIF